MKGNCYICLLILSMNKWIKLWNILLLDFDHMIVRRYACWKWLQIKSHHIINFLVINMYCCNIIAGFLMITIWLPSIAVVGPPGNDTMAGLWDPPNIITIPQKSPFQLSSSWSLLSVWSLLHSLVALFLSVVWWLLFDYQAKLWPAPQEMTP